MSNLPLIGEISYKDKFYYYDIRGNIYKPDYIVPGPLVCWKEYLDEEYYSRLDTVEKDLELRVDYEVLKFAEKIGLVDTRVKYIDPKNYPWPEDIEKIVYNYNKTKLKHVDENNHPKRNIYI